MISEQNIPTHAHNESANSAEPSDSLSVIGISLVFGFVFMLVVDQVFKSPSLKRKNNNFRISFLLDYTK